jgi:hypothetical protein
MSISASRLAGQLTYLFEDDPKLRSASPEQLAARLNHDDRWARAREHSPMATDAEVAATVEQFEERITVDLVRDALARLRR